MENYNCSLSRVSNEPLRRIRLLVKRAAYQTGISRPIVRLWNTYEHVRFVYHVWRNRRSRNVDAEIDPFHLYWISTRYLRNNPTPPFDFLADTGKVIGGTWDRNLGPLTDNPAYYLFEHHFEGGIPWKETEYYNRITDDIRRGESTRYATVDELEEKFELYERIYEAFESGEYYLQSELTTKGHSSVPGDGGRALFPSRTDRSLIRHEIAVNVGRDGQFPVNDGRHRASLALLAGLSEVPVRIVVRHTEWQTLRDEVVCMVDEALEEGVPPEDVREYVEKALTDELEGVFLGIEHPDLDVIFEHRLPND